MNPFTCPRCRRAKVQPDGLTFLGRPTARCTKGCGFWCSATFRP
jgi:hypothetical protein